MSIDGAPTRPRFSSIQVVETDDSLVLTWQTISPAFLFLAFWLFGCVIGLVFLVWALAILQQPVLFLVGVSIWIGWTCASGLLAGRIKGFHRLKLSPEGLEIEKHAFGMVSNQQFPLSELRRIRVRKFRSNSDDPDSIGIEIVTLGRSFAFGRSLTTLERDWIADRMEQMLLELRQPDEAGEREDDLLDCRDCEPPSDSAWLLDPDSGTLAFRQTGRRHVGRLVGITFFNLIWNGVVSIFVCGLWGLIPSEHGMGVVERGFLFVFLIPFEAIGLLMLIGFFSDLLEPVRVTRWIFRLGSIEHATTRLDLPLGLRRVYPADELRIAAVRDDLGPPRWPWMSVTEEGAHYGLLLIDADNREVCSIRQLTLGEARWMKGMLQDRGLAAVDLSAPPLPHPSAIASSSAIRPGR